MIFSFTEKLFLDKNLVKVVYGVAGRGKSSIINNFFQTNNISYIWATSTNKLKRDAKERYGCEALTVCSTLFTSEDGRFYINEKEPDCKTIVIDEILQTSKKTFDWVRHHVGKYNIIILTDVQQMIATNDSFDLSFLELFFTFLREPFVISDEGKTTKRARDIKTKKKIEDLYTASGDVIGIFSTDLRSGIFPVIRYADMEYNTHDVYITHLNESEDFIYRDKSFASQSFTPDELIPKGTIASKPPKDPSKYPILSQWQAERQNVRAYYQLANMSSCTRYQGSEVTTKQKLYYIVTPDSVVTNREWYTVVSRCWSIDSIVIVIIDRVKKEQIKSFNGKVVKNIMVLSILSGDIKHEESKDNYGQLAR